MNPSDLLTHENFVLYCAKHYDNPQCHSTEEFYEDLQRIKYIKKLFTRYLEIDELKERLILNHIIVLNNVFGPVHSVRILFLKIEDKHWHLLKPFLILLNILPDVLINIGKIGSVMTDEIKMDETLVNVLRKI